MGLLVAQVTCLSQICSFLATGFRRGTWIPHSVTSRSRLDITSSPDYVSMLRITVEIGDIKIFGSYLSFI